MAILALLLMTVGAVGAQFEPAEPQEDCEYFEATQHNLCEPFQGYWNENGELEVFGYPISEAFQERNPDLNVELRAQYFERERMEHHPENAGTEYEILLGRLGAQTLELREVNWFAFPKDDPSAPHYFGETGFAVPEEFWQYWSSHGLDLGDPGISFRESLALFGYPISPVQTETNMAGDTVPTQWFERARFELHEGGLVLFGLLGVELVELTAPPPLPEPPGEVVAEGLNTPRGMTVVGENVFLAQSGVGGDECVTTLDPGTFEETEACLGYSGEITRIASGEVMPAVAGLPSIRFTPDVVAGPVDVIVTDDGQIYGLISGPGPEPANWPNLGGEGPDFALILRADADGSWTPIADLGAYEAAANPDGDIPEGNPWSFLMTDDGGFVVTDPGGNTLLHVDAEGAISTLAVFQERMVDAPPFLDLPEGAQIPMDPVPTGLALGPDGAYYVGQLTGFPFPVGGANVYRVTADGNVSIYAEGFTNIIDLAFDTNGNLYVLEMVTGGLLNAGEDLSTLASKIIKVAPDGSRTEIPSEGLFFATGLAVGPDGAIYVSNFGVMPGMGQVVRILPE